MYPPFSPTPFNTRSSLINNTRNKNRCESSQSLNLTESTSSSRELDRRLFKAAPIAVLVLAGFSEDLTVFTNNFSCQDSLAREMPSGRRRRRLSDVKIGERAPRNRKVTGSMRYLISNKAPDLQEKIIRSVDEETDRYFQLEEEKENQRRAETFHEPFNRRSRYGASGRSTSMDSSWWGPLSRWRFSRWFTNKLKQPSSSSHGPPPNTQAVGRRTRGRSTSLFPGASAAGDAR